MANDDGSIIVLVYSPGWSTWDLNLCRQGNYHPLSTRVFSFPTLYAMCNICHAVLSKWISAWRPGEHETNITGRCWVKRLCWNVCRADCADRVSGADAGPAPSACNSEYINVYIIHLIVREWFYFQFTCLTERPVSVQSAPNPRIDAVYGEKYCSIAGGGKQVNAHWTLVSRGAVRCASCLCRTEKGYG